MYSMLHLVRSLDLLLGAGFFAAVGIGWFFPTIGNRYFGAIESGGAHVAKRKALAILALTLAVPLFRFALLPILRVPAPAIHDEFSYLLAADTFAHGRLTNPPHPLWRFFETIHVNQRPTYMSKYFPAQGVVLAAGQLLGHPWIGVVLSMAAMCGAILWMLQGWLPPRWALLGAVLVFTRLALFSYWVNSYWGGAVAACGGALVMGALPRILRRHRPHDALLMGLGIAILVNSRPFEGFLLCLPVAVVLTIWLLSRRSPMWSITLQKVCAPIAGVLLLTTIFLCYYNWRGTGHPLLTPYQVNERTYMSTPPFAWQSLRAPQHYLNPQFEAFYNTWARSYWLRMRFAVHRRAVKFTYFYLWPEHGLPFLVLPWLLGRRKTRFLLIQFASSFAVMMAIVWFEPHYAAPLLATLCGLLVQAMRQIRRWRRDGRPVGIGITRAIVIYSVAMLFVYGIREARNPDHQSLVSSEAVWGTPGNWQRAQVLARFQAMPGEHLAIVRYSPEYGGGEWVYNGADLDHAKVVWAREIPGVDPKPLLDYYQDRSAWLVEPGPQDAKVSPYSANLCLISNLMK
jgi:hypothetical protein